MDCSSDTIMISLFCKRPVPCENMDMASWNHVGTDGRIFLDVLDFPWVRDVACFFGSAVSAND